MLKFVFSLFKSTALIAIGAAGAIYAPTILEELPVPPALASYLPFAVTAPVEEPVMAEGPKAPSIRVVAAENREIIDAISATGSIMPRNEAQIGADVSGLMVEELFFDVGDSVKKGDRLARLDRTNLELQMLQQDAQIAQNLANLAQTEAQVADFEITVKQAQEQLDRILPLVQSGVVSRAQRDDAQNALDGAKARLASARQAAVVVQSQNAVIEAQRKQTALQLAKTDVLAPVDGLILTRAATLGQVVSGAAGPLFTIATDTAFELAAEVPESDLARLSPGMRTEVVLPGRSEPLIGKIRTVSPQVNAASRLGTVKIELPQDTALRNGSFARSVIELERKTIIAVPSAALLYRGDAPFVQKVVDGKVVSTPVEIGLRDNRFVGILSGLALGEEVISRAGTFVGDGDEVIAVRENEATGATGQ
jgi:HlyD family secretion protein